MQDSSIFFHALAYIAFIILSGVGFLICFIFFVIRLSQGHKHKWNWLIAGVIALLTLLFSIFLFVSKVVNTVKDLGQHVEQKFEESMEDLQKLDSSYKYDDLNTNETLKKLKEFEAMNNETNAPKEFYVYYGFADYHRMPLTYPYSLHSVDVLETATLFDEKNVVEFNVNDNGEIETGRPGVTEFAFDNSAFIGKGKDEKGKDYYWIFSLNNPKLDFITNIQTTKEAFKTARKEYGYRGYDTLISVLEYHKFFK
jgi:hypothetical protein